MIHFDKSAAAPPALAAGLALTAADEARYDADPASYQLRPRQPGARKFTFDSGVYGHADVKAALKADQNDKCGFCEALFDANVAGDVEHLRPKGAVITSSRTTLRPGYYWLAYVWSNLLYACPDCNQYKKRNHYPLRIEGDRARTHRDSIAAENPLLIDPMHEDPRHHIGFNGEVPVWTDDRGEQTIVILGLDRDGLLRDRRQHLAHLTAYHDTVDLLDGDPRPRAVASVATARLRLAEAVLPAAKFSSAAIDHIDSLKAGNPPPP